MYKKSELSAKKKQEDSNNKSWASSRIKRRRYK